MSYLRGIWVLPFVALLLCDTALAQRGRHAKHEAPYDPFEKIVHPTPELARTPGGRAAFRWYHEQKAAEHMALPESFSMRGNYPNPFQQSALLVFDLPWSAWVTVEVMDLTGRRVLTVPAQRLAPGWGRSIEVMSESGLPSGLYLYRMTVTSPEGSSSHRDNFKRIR